MPAHPKALLRDQVQDAAYGVIANPPPPPPTTVSITTPPADTTPDPTGPVNVNAILTRQWPKQGPCSVDWAVQPGAQHPVAVADFVNSDGLLPHGTASFGVGQTVIPVQFQTAAEAPPARAKYGQFWVGNPVGCQIVGTDPTPFALLPGPKLGGKPGAPFPSGLAWASGFSPSGDQFDPNGTWAQIQEFAAFRNRAVDILNEKSNNATLDSLISAFTSRVALYNKLFPNGVAVSQVLDYVSDDMAKTLPSPQQFQAVANGNFDAKYHQMFVALNALPRIAPFIIRLEHEYGATGYGGANNDPDPLRAHAAAAFAHVAGLIRAFNWADPQPLIDLNFIRGDVSGGDVPDLATCLADPMYFDIIGPDFYYNKNAPNLASAADWDAWSKKTQGSISKPVGLGAWFAYAQSIGKYSSMPEWATSTNLNPGGWGSRDNPWFIDGVWRTINDYVDTVLYENWFFRVDAGAVQCLNVGPINHTTASPLATAKYKALWGA